MTSQKTNKRSSGRLAASAFLFAFFPVIPAHTQTEAARKVQPSIVVTLSPAKVSVHLSSSVVFESTVTNVSRSRQYWEGSFTHYRDLSYSLTLKGKPVKKTQLLREISSDPLPGEVFTEPTSSVAFPVEPGEKRHYTIKLNELYELTAPGIYEFVVSAYDKVLKRSVSSKPAIMELRQ